MVKDKQLAAYKKAFGHYLKEKRINSKMTQEALADRLGNNRQNISAIERGEINPTLIKIRSIAAAFDMTVGEMLIEFEEEYEL